MIIPKLLILLPLTAMADTVTLGGEDCTRTNICYQVPNDAGLDIAYISDAIQYRRLLIQIGSELYDSGEWVLNGQMNQTNVPLYAGGSVIYATLNFTVTTGPCVREGRVTVCPRFVHLNGGTLTR